MSADALSVLFDDEPAKPAQPKPLTGGKPSLSVVPPKPAAPTTDEERDVSEAADEWREVAGTALIIGLGFLLGRELAPTQQEAASITVPLLRILMRHVSVLREASADTVDAVTCLTATVVYVQRIAPLYATKMAEKKVNHVGANQPDPAAVVGRQREQRGPVRLNVPGRPAGQDHGQGATGQSGDTALSGDRRGGTVAGTSHEPEGAGDTDSAAYGLSAEALYRDAFGVTI